MELRPGGRVRFEAGRVVRVRWAVAVDRVHVARATAQEQCENGEFTHGALPPGLGSSGRLDEHGGAVRRAPNLPLLPHLVRCWHQPAVRGARPTRLIGRPGGKSADAPWASCEEASRWWR